MRGDPLAAARAAVMSCPDGVDRQALSVRLLQHIRHKWSSATSGDIALWMSTVEGRIFCLWQAIRHSGVSYEWAYDVVCDSVDRFGESWLDGMTLLVERASGGSETDHLANIRNVGDSGSTDDEISPFPNYDFVLSLLTKEPFSMTKDEVLDLTLHQLSIICKPKDAQFGDDRVDELGVRAVKSGMARRVVEKTWRNSYHRYAENLSKGKNIKDGLSN
jgi:hypothetical protein